MSAISTIPCKNHLYSPVIISQLAWQCFRFYLSFRVVELRMAELIKNCKLQFFYLCRKFSFNPFPVHGKM